MTYKDNFVVEVKHKGRILRSKDGYVLLPFGSEYSLLIKNLDSRKARVDVHIDGEDVLDGNSLVIDGNQTTELEGFLRGNIAKNRFKFIQKTSEISDYRGDRIDDGLVVVKFSFEKEPVVIKRIIEEHHEHHHHHHHDRWYYQQPLTWRYDGTATPSGGITYSNSAGAKDGTIQDMFSGDQVQTFNCSVENLETPIDDLGITVKGSEVNQQFSYASIGMTEKAQVIVLQLRGTTSKGIKLEKPVTVKTRLTCSTCGKKSKSSFKFCPNCGTFLE